VLSRCLLSERLKEPRVVLDVIRSGNVFHNKTPVFDMNASPIFVVMRGVRSFAEFLVG
jgi:hypothetical protein